jgi:hypothetical protein
MTPQSGFFAQYYELTLRVRPQGEKWNLVVLGPQGLVLTDYIKYGSAAEAEQVAISMAQKNLHQDKHDGRPLLAPIDWQEA